MAVNLSLLGGAGWQFLDNNGAPLSGGFIYTYAAGTTTNQATYTDVTGNIANPNPIILDSSGRPPSEIWLLNGYSYKFVVTTSSGVQIRSYDNIPSTSTNLPIINDASSISYEEGYTVTAGSFVIGDTYQINTLGTTNFTTIGASQNIVGVNFTATGIGSGTGTAYLSQTVQTKLRQYISILDFGADSTGTVDSTSALNNALATGRPVYMPKGIYRINNCILPDYAVIYGDDGQSPCRNGTVLSCDANNSVFIAQNTKQSFRLSNFSVTPLGSGTKFLSQTMSAQSDVVSYSSFENITTDLGITVSYDGNFIFCKWLNCTDGYYGTPYGSGTYAYHHFIRAWPGTITPDITVSAVVNINEVTGCNIFNAYGISPESTSGAVFLCYGAVFNFYNCDFEAIRYCAVNCYSMAQVNMNDCWVEAIGNGVSTSAPPYAVIQCQTATGAYGTTEVNITGTRISLDLSAQYLSAIYFDAASANGSVNNCTFTGLSAYNTISNIPKYVTYSNLSFPNGTATNIANFLIGANGYQQGQIVVALSTGTGSITLNSSYNTLAYTKNGNLVTVTGYLQASSVSTPTGDLIVTSLPYIVAANASNYSSVAINIVNCATAVTGYVSGFVEPGTNYIYIRRGGTTGVGNDMAAYVQATTGIYINVSYITG